MTQGRTALNGAPRGHLPVAVCVEERLLRESICGALRTGGHSIARADATIAELLESRNGNGSGPACVVASRERPDHSALQATRSIRAKLGDISAVLVCRRASGAEVRRALELGVDGVVLHDDIERALAAVVAAVCAGQVSVPRQRRSEAPVQALTTREKQILALVVTGMTNAQIAGQLFLAESTVKSHLSSAFVKLGVSSRYEATTVILDPERGRGLGIREVEPGLAALQPLP